MPNKTIAVLYIALGRYSIFWKDFYTSSEKYFLKNKPKTYFIFTDNENIEFQNNKNVKKIYQKKLGWPYDTMLRFKMFLKQKEELKNFDYIFFFNANMEFIADVNEEILPNKNNDGLVMGLHPGFYNKPKEEFTYDRNPNSQTYIPIEQGKYYVQGCLNGGTNDAYLKLCTFCNEMIEKDMRNNILPLWHDESALNKYILDKNPLIMPCNYLYPENWDLAEFKNNIKIIQRNKSNPKYGGINYLRGENIKNNDTTIFLSALLKKMRAKTLNLLLRFFKKF